MGTISKTHTFAAGATIIASEHNTNFDQLFTLVNGNIENVNVKAGAEIAAAKLNLETIAQSITFTGTLDFSGATITAQTTFADLVATTADINGGTLSDITIDGNWTAASQTCADLGTVTTADIDGGTLDGVQIGGTTATGELIVNNSSDAADGLGSQGTAGQYLKSAGAGSNPTWETMPIIYRGTDEFDSAQNSDGITIDGTVGNIIYVTVQTTSAAGGGGSGSLVIQLGTTATGYVNVIEKRNVTDSSTAYDSETSGFYCGDPSEGDETIATFRIQIIGNNEAVAWGTSRFTDSSNKDQVSQISGFYTGSTAHTSVRAYFSSAACATGDIWVWEAVA